MLILPTKALDTGVSSASERPNRIFGLAGLVSECDAFYNPRQYVQAGRAYCTAGCWRGSAATRGAIKAAACSQIGRRIAGFLRDNASSDLALAASEKPTTLMGAGMERGHNPKVHETLWSPRVP